MLIGQYKSKLTDKDRISVPKKIRLELGEKLIIARWYESCLVLVSQEGWDKLTKRIMGKLDLVVLPVRDIDRFILGAAYEVELDKQGRFIVPDILKQFASITDEVTFVGLGDRVEIWATSVWQEFEETSEKRAARAIEEIAKQEIGK